MLPLQITLKQTNLSRTSKQALEGLLQDDISSMKIPYGYTLRTIFGIALTVMSIAFLLVVFVTSANAQTPRPVKHGGRVCGNPQIKGKTSVTFSPNDLPFEVGPQMVIVDTAPFYAIILKSAAVVTGGKL